MEKSQHSAQQRCLSLRGFKGLRCVFNLNSFKSKFDINFVFNDITLPATEGAKFKFNKISHGSLFLVHQRLLSLKELDIHACMLSTVCVYTCLCFFSAWLEGEEDPVILRVNQRIEDITGLTVDTAELLQVMYFILQNYMNHCVIH